MDRRKFIRQGIITSSGLMFIPPALAESNIFRLSPEVPPADSVYRSFRTPPMESRPFVRWWWNGNRLDKNEILRELDIMKQAGIGGVEINPIAFPSGSDPAGYEPMTMYDPSWLEMLETALKGAGERQLTCDMIVGSGWPFGGEFLEKDYQTQLVTIATRDLNEGTYALNIQDLLDTVDLALHSKNDNTYKDLIAVRLLPKASEVFTPGADLISEVEDGVLKLEVPSGEHVLYYVVKLTGYMAVINGAPGAAGPVLNHYSREATETYLNRISHTINTRIGHMGNYIRAMFCDSMELEGANWTDDLPEEFEKRRGYDLWPYLPLILKKTGHMGNPVKEEYGTAFSEKVKDELKRVEIDFYHTRMELFRERFITPFNEWCHRNGVQSRMQAYGRGMHPLEASMEVDIPECETWLFRDVGREFPDTGLKGRAPRMCNKYVSSAAVLSGKELVSCEEITNTAMVFMATLENIKIAGDQSNISGVNHSVLHGFNYSPPEAAFPGWVRYGTYFNENNTWWLYFRKWADYKARLSFLLREATPLAHVAILQPLTDLWLEYGPQRDPFPEHWYPEYQNNLWEVIHQNGDSCDYVSENIINRSEFRKGRMHYNQRSYDTILLPEIKTLNLQTARSLEEFARSGGRLIFIGNSPFKSASYADSAAQDAGVKEITDRLVQEEKAILYPAPETNLLEWYGTLQKECGIVPYVAFDHPRDYLSQSVYDIRDKRVHLIANTGLSGHISVKATFNTDPGLHAWIWDAETGERMRYPHLGDPRTLQLELPRATSVLIVFDKEKKGTEYPVPTPAGGDELKGSWKLALHHIDGSVREKQLTALTDLSAAEDSRNFAGKAVYTLTFRYSGTRVYRYIDLGNVQGISELSLNGQELGCRWYGAHRYDISEALAEGENILTVTLTTIIGNYVKSLKDNTVAQNWTKHQQHYPMGILGPVTLG